MGAHSRAEGETPGSGRRARFALPLLTALLVLVAAAPAQATFHLIKVREVFAGLSDNSYVELQMYAGGQRLLSGHSMTVYNSNGTLLHSSTFSAAVPNSENQQTVLIGDSGVQAAFGIAPDLVDPGLSIAATGGAACWNAGGIPADCVAWGNFSGASALQTATGTSAGAPVSPSGITAGKAIRRTIAPGCPTLLEESDDSDDSATDFAETTPAPRNDASPIVEKTCPGVPNTAIDDKPALHSSSASAEFTYEAPTATSYECKLDSPTFSTCPTGGPQQYSNLADGSHTFQVRGVNASGPDPTPASYTWSVDTVPPIATIDTHPANGSPGASASFTYHAPGEPGSTFKCSLDGAPPTACALSGITYHNLEDGIHGFEVEATDAAGNHQLAPTAFSWTVDNMAVDSTPPETTIESKPPDPSGSSTASFTYASNEPGSSFECALDGAAFSSCPPAGVSYAGLADGPHSFQVRAIDPSHNVDPTPAGYSFSVVLVPAPPPGMTAIREAASPPETAISGKPPAKTRDRTPTFRFRSNEPGATFQCRFDGKPFKPCRSPFTPKPLAYGSHTLQVRATVTGAVDPSPVKFRFRIVKG